jgi:hypothetical protein
VRGKPAARAGSTPLFSIDMRPDENTTQADSRVLKESHPDVLGLLNSGRPWFHPGIQNGCLRTMDAS